MAWARAGASVVLAGRKPDQLAKVDREIKAIATDPFTKAISVSVDIKIESQVQNLLIQIQKNVGRPADVLIDNAGAVADDGPVSLGQGPRGQFTNIFGSHSMGLHSCRRTSSAANPSLQIQLAPSFISLQHWLQ